MFAAPACMRVSIGRCTPGAFAGAGSIGADRFDEPVGSRLTKDGIRLFCRSVDSFFLSPMLVLCAYWMRRWRNWQTH